MTIRATQAGELAAPTRHVHGRSSAHGQPDGNAFAQALTDATAKTTKTAKTAEPAGAKDIALRKHETMTPVAGRAFAEIDGGRRDGLYVNTSDNARRGEVFTMAVRHGRELHIYGTGADRVVVSVPVRKDDDLGDTSLTGGATPTATSRS